MTHTKARAAFSEVREHSGSFLGVYRTSGALVCTCGIAVHLLGDVQAGDLAEPETFLSAVTKPSS